MRRPWLALPLVLAACGPADQPDAGAEAELLRELRALRGSIERQQAAPDRRQLDAALLPLRELLQGLVAEQGTLRERQQALAGELVRWSGLVAQTASAESKGELAALQERLGRLETELGQQDARHREVQELMRKALDATADRLEAFLGRLAELPATGGAPPVDAGKAPVTEPGPPPATGPPGPPGGQPDPAGETVRRGGMEWLRPGHAAEPGRRDLLTPLLLVIGIATVGLLGWRLYREGKAARQPAPPEPMPDASWFSEEQATPALPRAPATEGAPLQGWQAVEHLAAVLSDQVQRVEEARARVTVDAEAAEPAPGPTAPPAGETDDEWILIEDEAPVPAPPTTPPPPVSAGGAGPCWLELDLPAGDPEQAEQALQAERQVLRRPGPSVQRDDRGLHLRFAVLPDLPPGERQGLVQRLRAGLPGNHGSRNGPSL